MKKSIAGLRPAMMAVILFLVSSALRAQTVCASSGNLMLFTNYDGGTLTINCDQNISNLKIGVCSYEAVRIVITGAFAGNLTEIRYAGYNSANNNHCSGGVVPTTTIIGAGSASTSIIYAPPSPFNNPNGYGSIICGYSCSNNTSQGGCNTIDQIEAYFLNYFSGSTLFAHRIQYGCWTGTLNLSSGGSCCPIPALNPGVVAPPVQNVCAGGVPAFLSSSVSASGGAGSITYTWQSSTTSTNSGFSNISGANSTTYQPGIVSSTTYYRRGSSTSSNSAVYSNVITVSVMPNPQVAMARNNPICEYGALQFTAVPTPVSYTWTGPLGFNTSLSHPTISPLSLGHSGTYSLAVTYSNGCTQSATAAIQVSPNATLTVVPASVTLCLGQTATLSASGGSTYLWQPGNYTGPLAMITPTASGPLDIICDLGFCGDTASVNVTVLPLPFIQAFASPTVVCSGVQQATLSANGASSYSWMPGQLTGITVTVSPSASTEYTVTGTDLNGCSAISAVSLAALPLPTVGLASNPNPGCPGAPVILDGTGANTYTWSPGGLTGQQVTVTPAALTSFTVAGTGLNGCENTSVFVVSVLPAPSVSVSGNFLSVCPGQSATLTASGAVSYSWHVTGVNNLASLKVSPSSTTVYTVTGAGSNFCKTVAAITVSVVSCTGVEEPGEEMYSIYPNPSPGGFVLKVKESTTFEFSDVEGRMIERGSLEAGTEKRFNIYSRGTFLLRITSANVSQTEKLVVTPD